MKWCRIVSGLIAGLVAIRCAGLTLSVDSVQVAPGTGGVVLAVRAAGGESLSELAALVRIVPADPAVPESQWPVVKEVRFSGSIWTNASGGFVTFQTLPLGTSTIDPNLALKAAGQSVPAAGILFEMVLDTSRCPPGLFHVRLRDEELGTTETGMGGIVRDATLRDGSVRIGTAPVEVPQLSISRGTGAPGLHFASQSGVSYRIERQGNALDSGWTSFWTGLGTGGVVTVGLDDDWLRPAPSTGFYRLVVVGGN